MKRPLLCLLPVLLTMTLLAATRARADTADTRAALLPVREVSIFKDGHAFVLRRGTVPTDGSGNVLLDDLPTPIQGTFWPFADDKDATLASVVAGQRVVATEKTALTLRDLLRANVGADVRVTEVNNPASYDATILSIPEAAVATDDGPVSAFTGTSAGASPLAAPGLIVLRTGGGDKALALDQIRDVTFRNPPRPARTDRETRPLMTLNLNWKGRTPARTAVVGMAYLQSGLRWLPSYKVTIDGGGLARVQLEATIINDLADLRDVSVNLVVGVPAFAAQDALDPISLQKTLADVSARLPQNSLFGGGFSNAYQSQVAYGGGGGFGGAPASAPDASAPSAPDGAKNEDLFVFTVRHVTLLKGQRLVMPVSEHSVKYADVYTLTLPYGPPPEVARSLSSDRQTDLARQLALPHVLHVLRLRDSTPQPFTTAPALILRGDRVLAQGTLTYTTPGASADLEVTQALDITYRKRDQESKRTLGAAVWNGERIDLVALGGTLTLTNGMDRPAALEVTREVLGSVDSADNGGAVERLDPLDDGDAPVTRFPAWWNWYGWPLWWGSFNGLGRVTWKTTLPPGKSVPLSYTWHYFWR